MKTFIVLVSLFATALCASLSVEAEGGAKDLIYHFFSKSNPHNSIKIRAGNTQVLQNSAFSAKKDTLFLVHGWKADNTSDFNIDIRTTILSISDVNVFVVDWGVYAGTDYIRAKNSVVKVGGYVADFVRELKQHFQLQLSSVKFVGWSLGAHVSGNAGAALGGQVDRITGLDPAGPLFSYDKKNERLDDSDAKYVQVIHTSSVLGFQQPSGHADFYPNGGKNQPGCGSDILGGCAHGRVFSLYVESLKSNRFVSRICGSWADYTKDKCNNNAKSIMGQFVPDYKARGSYFLATNQEPPFARG